MMEEKNAVEKKITDRDFAAEFEERWLKKFPDDAQRTASKTSEALVQPDGTSKGEWQQGAEILKTMLADPIGVLKEVWAEWFPPSEKPKVNSQPARVASQLSVPTKEGSVSVGQKTRNDTCRICTGREQTIEGRTIFNYSFYSRSALDAISFDPFIVEADISHDNARSQGLSGLLRLKQEAWLEERLTEATVRKLQSRQTILEAQRRTTETGHRLNHAIHNPVIAPSKPVEQGSIDYSIQATSQQVRPALPSPAPSLAPLRPNVTDDQIDAAAIRALLEGVTTEEHWTIYREALSRHLPPYAVLEVKDRLRELLALNPDGPTANFE